MKKLILFLIMLGLLSGCASLQIKRSVDPKTNIFTSTRYPEIKIAINPDFKYIGEVSRSGFSHNTDDDISGFHEEYQHFVFVKGDKTVEKFFTITIMKIQENWTWNGLFNKNDKRNLCKEVVRLGNTPYQSVIRTSKKNLFYSEEEDLLLEHGFFVDNSYIFINMGKMMKGRNMKVHIWYGRALKNDEPQADWTTDSYLSVKQEEIIKNLRKDFNKDINFLPIN